MSKIKTVEKAIAKSLKTKNPYTERTFKVMSICMYVYDNIFHTSHLKNIKAIYIKHPEDTMVKISQMLNTEERTLERYRNQYLKCFDLCEFAIKYFDELFNFF